MAGIRRDRRFMAALVTIKTPYTYIHRKCKINYHVCRIHRCSDLQQFDSEVCTAVGNIKNLPPPTYGDKQIHLSKSCIEQTLFLISKFLLPT
jgi:hypothetical protein